MAMDRWSFLQALSACFRRAPSRMAGGSAGVARRPRVPAAATPLEQQFQRIVGVIRQTLEGSARAGRCHAEARQRLDATEYAFVRMMEDLALVMPVERPLATTVAIALPAIREPRRPHAQPGFAYDRAA